MKEIAIFLWWFLVATGAVAMTGVIIIAVINSIVAHFTKRGAKMKTENVLKHERQIQEHKRNEKQRHRAIKKSRHAKRKMPNNW